MKFNKYLSVLVAVSFMIGVVLIASELTVPNGSRVNPEPGKPGSFSVPTK
jgi:hypothetical protein